MKRTFALITAALALAACGGNRDTAADGAADSAATVSPAPDMSGGTGAGATTGATTGTGMPTDTMGGTRPDTTTTPPVPPR